MEQTSSFLNYLLFPFHLFGMWQRKSAGDPLKIHIDCDIVSEQGRERVCVCVRRLQLPPPWKLLRGKMLTINNQRNLVIFPFVGRWPADLNLKQTQHWSHLCPGWHEIIWREKSGGRERAQEMKSEGDKVREVTESESPDHFKKSNSTLETLRKTPYLRKFMLCTQHNLQRKKRKAAAAWQLNQGA